MSKTTAGIAVGEGEAGTGMKVSIDRSRSGSSKKGGKNMKADHRIKLTTRIEINEEKSTTKNSNNSWPNHRRGYRRS